MVFLFAVLDWFVHFLYMGSFNYVEFLCCSMQGYCWFSILITDLCLSWSGSGIYEYLSFHFKVCFFGFFFIIFRFGFLFCYVWLNAYFDLLSKRLAVSQLKCLLCGWRSCKEYSKLKLKTRISFEESYIDKNLMIYLTVNVFLQLCADWSSKEMLLQFILDL